VEGGYEKVDKLLEIRDGARKQLRNTEEELEQEKQDLMNIEGEDAVTPEVEDIFYIRRFDGGLFILQIVDYILAWLMMEDDGIRAHSLRMLDRRNQTLQDILQTLRIYHDHIDNNDGGEATVSQKNVLDGLISALDSAGGS